MPSRQFELFVRSLAENPTYGEGVLWLWKITTNAAPWAPLRPSFRHLLCKLPNLRMLGMSRTLDNLGDKLFSRHLPLQNTLHHLPIEEKLPIAWELLSLPYLYLIRSLGIFDENEIQFDDENLPFTPRDLRAAPNPKLDFRSFTNVYISPSALQAVHFSCSGYLQTLFTIIPAEQQWLESSSQQRRRFRIFRPFSAALRTPVFAPLSRTLTDLVITPGFQEWQGHDGTRLDLSSFVALKNLTASALCFVPPLGREYSRDGLYKILPKLLEIIHLDFGFETGIFYSIDDDGTIETLGREKFVETKYGSKLIYLDHRTRTA